MSARPFEDSSLPPPGTRTGAGTASILAYLRRTLATRPQPAVLDAPVSQVSQFSAPVSTRLPAKS